MAAGRGRIRRQRDLCLLRLQDAALDLGQKLVCDLLEDVGGAMEPRQAQGPAPATCCTRRGKHQEEDAWAMRDFDFFFSVCVSLELVGWHYLYVRGKRVFARLSLTPLVKKMY